jgi:hypothetical protein
MSAVVETCSSIVDDNLVEPMGKGPRETTRVTTLFDLMANMQETGEPEDSALIVPTIVHWLRSGRIQFLRKTALLAELSA